MYNIIIDREEENTIVAVIENGELVELYNEKNKEKRLEGNIYLGKIKNIIPGMQSAFIDIGEEKKALVHIKDIIPKASTVTGNVYEDMSKYDITKIVKSGDEILVQVKRDCNEQKGPRVTKDIKINGKLIILMPYSDFVTISQKIEDENEIKRLKEIVKKELPSGYGAIIRTAAEGKSENEILSEVKLLTSFWDNILKRGNEIKNKNIAPIKIFDNDGIVGKIITDLAENNLENIYTNDPKIKESFENMQDKIIVQNDVLDNFDVKNKMKLDRKIWLNCGGFITIDRTEALTAIDVNSGKFTGSKNLEKTVLKVNKEATKEIAKQIRLRDIGGIIIIDYIDMEDEKDKEDIRNYIIECFKEDRSKVQVLEFTKLGLLEITRKHILGR